MRADAASSNTLASLKKSEVIERGREMISAKKSVAGAAIVAAAALSLTTPASANVFGDIARSVGSVLSGGMASMIDRSAHGMPGVRGALEGIGHVISNVFQRLSTALPAVPGVPSLPSSGLVRNFH